MAVIEYPGFRIGVGVVLVISSLVMSSVLSSPAFAQQKADKRVAEDNAKSGKPPERTEPSRYPAADGYKAKYYFAGLLFRAAGVCEGKREAYESTGRLIISSDKDMIAFSKAFEETVMGWGREGVLSFNKEVFKVGVAAACKNAETTNNFLRELETKGR